MIPERIMRETSAALKVLLVRALMVELGFTMRLHAEECVYHRRVARPLMPMVAGMPSQFGNWAPNWEGEVSDRSVLSDHWYAIERQPCL
jgi:hypothetical protein